MPINPKSTVTRSTTLTAKATRPPRRTFCICKTHLTRIYQGDYDDQAPDQTVFLDIEYIDRIKLIGPGPGYGSPNDYAAGQEMTLNIFGSPPTNIPQYNQPGYGS